MNIKYDLPVIGVCRFSFVGRGDWAEYRDRSIDHEGQEFRQHKAAELYAFERMERRFFTLDKFLLNSLSAQTDGNFYLIILTSDLMPDKYKRRLNALCDIYSFARAVYSSEVDVSSALIPEIEKIKNVFESPLVQFRIDDDDCLSQFYVERLRRAACRFEDLDNFAYSIPKGLVATAYSDKPQHFYELFQPFHSAGCAFKPHRADRTIFSFGHFAIQRRFTSFIDHANFGHLSLKLDDQDSQKLHSAERARRGHVEVGKQKFMKWIDDFFPSIDPKDIQSIKLLSPGHKP